MKSSLLGKNISNVDLNITKFGIWLYCKNQEFFLAYTEYPFFKNATIKNIYNLKLLHKTHLYWPALDIDLDIKILENPHHFPLIAKMPSLK